MSAEALARRRCPTPIGYYQERCSPASILRGRPRPSPMCGTSCGQLMDAGIDSFVDLTMPDEFDSYEDALPPDVNYARRPIRDHGIPSRAEQMIEIVAHIERELQQRPARLRALSRGNRAHGHGRRVPPHRQRRRRRSRAGASLNRLWRTCDRSRTWPYVPETDAQIAFVRAWRPVGRPSRATRLAVSRSGAAKGAAPTLAPNLGLQDRFRGVSPRARHRRRAAVLHPRGSSPGPSRPLPVFPAAETLKSAARRMERRHRHGAVRCREPDPMWSHSTRAIRWSAARTGSRTGT